MREQVTFPGMEPVEDPQAEAARRAAEARRIFEAEEGYAPWMEDYWRLIGEGWPWRQAVYMLWAALPGDKRTPRTQEELATQVLGLTSDRQISKWKQNPAMEAEIAKLAASALAKHRPEIYRALIEAASNPNPRAHADRKLALEMLGDYDPRIGLTIRRDVETPEDVAALSDEELQALAGGPDGE